jgi:DNA-binding NarL/FixJ family response regulator
VTESEEPKQAPSACPLSPAMLRLLQDATALGTTNNKQLARHRGCPEETIKSLFYRINLTLGTKSRSEAILKSISSSWIDIKAI